MADISKEDLRKEIAAILKGADLASTSAKKVRQELEEKLDVKLQSRKKEIDDLVMEFVSAKKDGGKKKAKKEESEDEAGEEDDDDEEEEEAEPVDKKKKRGTPAKKPPPAKKIKKGSAEEESGSEQSEGESEEEYSPKKATKPAKTRKLTPKKKKGGSESDSDEDWGKKKAGAKKGGARKGGGGYTRPLQLSPELSALVGADTMARHEVVKKVWSIIKEKNLYDPKNKQYAICNDALFKVIGTKRFRTFGMMKYLKTHFIS